MASVHDKADAEKGLYDFGSLENQGRNVYFCFGLHPRPKAILFWRHPIMSRF